MHTLGNQEKCYNLKNGTNKLLYQTKTTFQNNRFMLTVSSARYNKGVRRCQSNPFSRKLFGEYITKGL